MTHEAFTILDDDAARPGSLPTCQVIVYYEDRSRVVKLPDGAEIDIGRSSGCTVQIDSERVSRRHAIIARSGNSITLADLESSNGTRLNGDKITATCVLAPGDEVTIGPATLVMTRRSPVIRRTTVATTSQMERRLEAEADRSRRYKRSFAVLVIRISGDATQVDGALARIAGHLRPMDEVAEYSADDVVVLVPEADERAAVSLAERLLAQEDAADIRVGVGVFPIHGRDGAQLIAQARTAMREAKPNEDRVSVSCAGELELVGANEIVVCDPQMRRVYEQAAKVAKTTMTVLVMGETGAGKDVVAQQLHRSSPRASGPFVRLNCACLPETLLESELFGHEKGAFTGADRRRIGHFESADGGTIFLDEIGEISAGLQAKLLRVLELHCFTRVGCTQEITSDVRVVCATNRNLEKEVEKGAFREDLLFRISAFTLIVPPLRDRPTEVLPLAESFLARMSQRAGAATPSMSTGVRKLLQSYDWPGNVRQLRNALERAMVLQTDGTIHLDHLPERVIEQAQRPSEAVSSAKPPDGNIRAQLASAERDAIASALEQCNQNQTQAAKTLGMSRRALIYKMERHGLKPPPGQARKRR